MKPMLSWEQKFGKLSLTFDDVLLLPGYSEVVPGEVDISTELVKGIPMKVPICSAAMDTVTEARLAIALAQEGGIGVIHKNLPVEVQAEHVDKVKRSESGMILKPITLGPNDTIARANALMAEFRISGVPITEKDGKLLGILTNRDLRFASDENALTKEYMTSEGLVTTSEGTTLEDAEYVLHKNRIEKLPVVDDEGYLCGLITVKDIEKKRKYPNAAKDEHGRLRVAAAIGVSEFDVAERAGKLLEAGCDVIVIDTAHGYSSRVGKAVKRFKTQYPNHPIVAGNVATGDGTKFLCDLGVDAVKVGMGPGSICTTRVISGSGVPQITAVYDCVSAAQGYDVKIIADGGIKSSGDVAKALAAGADSVMIGNLFAGTDEAPGETIIFEGRTFKVYRGMGSLGAMQKGSKDRYGQAEVLDEGKLVPEGIEGRVPYRGNVAGFILQLSGGLRAGMGYCGVRNLPEFKEQARFTQITQASLQESHAHDVIVTKEAPNYRLGG